MSATFQDEIKYNIVSDFIFFIIPRPKVSGDLDFARGVEFSSAFTIFRLDFKNLPTS